MNNAVRPRIVPLLVITLAVLAALKLTGIVVGFSSATAQVSEAAPALETATLAAQIAPATSNAIAVPNIAPGEVERSILARLSSRREELDQREAELELRETVIAAVEAQLERGLDAFEQERREIEALRSQRNAENTEEIAVLVSTYEKMKARDAAAIFNELDEDILLAVASNMRTQALAGVLADMAPDRARLLTELLAKRGRLISDDSSVANNNGAG